MTAPIKRKFVELQIQEKKDGRAESLMKARGMKKLKKEILKKPYPQGHKFSQEDKNNILHIYHTLKTHKEFNALSTIDTSKLTSILYGCTRVTVEKIIQNNGIYEDGRKNRFFRDKEIPVRFREVFQNQIRRGLEKGRRLTCNFFREMLFKDAIMVSNDTVSRKLREWGLRWGSLSEKDFRRKNQSTIELRKEYLRKLLELKEQGFENRVFLDESFVHQNHSFNKGWFIHQEGNEIHKPMGLGPRIAIMGALTETGWLKVRSQNIKRSLSKTREDKIHSYNSIKYWHVKKKKNGDEEETENVNYTVFKNYFENNVLPHLDEKSIIILDNARYHKKFNSEIFVPKSNSTKEELKEYVYESSQGEENVEKMKKPELLKLAKGFFKDVKNEIEQMAEEKGHIVLYLPPYHPELNPIELAWGFVKGKAAENPSYNIDTLMKETLPEAFASLCQNTVSNFFSHVSKQEDFYRSLIAKDGDTETIEEEVLESDIGSMYDDDNESDISELTDISYDTSDEEDN